VKHPCAWWPSWSSHPLKCDNRPTSAAAPPSSTHSWRALPKPWHPVLQRPPQPERLHAPGPESKTASMERLEIPTGWSESRQRRPSSSSTPRVARVSPRQPLPSSAAHPTSSGAVSCEPSHHASAHASAVAATYVPPPTRTAIMLQLDDADAGVTADDDGERDGHGGDVMARRDELAGGDALPPDITEEDSEYRDYSRCVSHRLDAILSEISVFSYGGAQCVVWLR
jgi:hypothetical protein